MGLGGGGVVKHASSMRLYDSDLCLVSSLQAVGLQGARESEGH